MKAIDHTWKMLQSWKLANVNRADLALRRRDGAMLWHFDLALDNMALPWARAENARGADVYIRPARGHDWPIVFLDDVSVLLARQLAQSKGALVIQTSPEGGCHLWLPCDRPLNEKARCSLQRDLAERYQADKGSVSGEHLGRLAGFRNWKRGGCWVNVLCEINPAHSVSISQESVLPPTEKLLRRAQSTISAHSGDISPSGIEWGWVCRLLETGHCPESVYRMLMDRAANRRGADVERYARRTVGKALQHIKRPR
jgi:hypothetical protein